MLLSCFLPADQMTDDKVLSLIFKLPEIWRMLKFALSTFPNELCSAVETKPGVDGQSQLCALLVQQLLDII